MVPAAVVEIVPVRVVEMVPAAVVEMVPALVVEIVPVRVVEIVPDLANALAESESVRKATARIDVNLVMMLLLVKLVRG
jgi:hypothetical protein